MNVDTKETVMTSSSGSFNGNVNDNKQTSRPIENMATGSINTTSKIGINNGWSLEDSASFAPPNVTINHSSNQLLFAQRQSQSQAVIVPRGWNRILEKGYITYISPNKSRLRSLEDLKIYFLVDGTCKCGIECPFRIEDVFNFNPIIPSIPSRFDSNKDEKDGCRQCKINAKFDQLFPPVSQDFLSDIKAAMSRNKSKSPQQFPASGTGNLNNFDNTNSSTTRKKAKETSRGRKRSLHRQSRNEEPQKPRWEPQQSHVELERVDVPQYTTISNTTVTDTCTDSMNSNNLSTNLSALASTASLLPKEESISTFHLPNWPRRQTVSSPPTSFKLHSDDISLNSEMGKTNPTTTTRSDFLSTFPQLQECTVSSNTSSYNTNYGNKVALASEPLTQLSKMTTNVMTSALTVETRTDLRSDMASHHKELNPLNLSSFSVYSITENNRRITTVIPKVKASKTTGRSRSGRKSNSEKTNKKEERANRRKKPTVTCDVANSGFTNPYVYINTSIGCSPTNIAGRSPVFSESGPNLVPGFIKPNPPVSSDTLQRERTCFSSPSATSLVNNSPQPSLSPVMSPSLSSLTPSPSQSSPEANQERRLEVASMSSSLNLRSTEAPPNVTLNPGFSNSLPKMLIHQTSKPATVPSINTSTVVLLSSANTSVSSAQGPLSLSSSPTTGITPPIEMIKGKNYQPKPDAKANVYWGSETQQTALPTTLSTTFSTSSAETISPNAHLSRKISQSDEVNCQSNPNFLGQRLPSNQTVSSSPLQGQPHPPLSKNQQTAIIQQQQQQSLIQQQQQQQSVLLQQQNQVQQDINSLQHVPDQIHQRNQKDQHSNQNDQRSNQKDQRSNQKDQRSNQKEQRLNLKEQRLNLKDQRLNKSQDQHNHVDQQPSQIDRSLTQISQHQHQLRPQQNPTLQQSHTEQQQTRTQQQQQNLTERQSPPDDSSSQQQHQMQAQQNILQQQQQHIRLQQNKVVQQSHTQPHENVLQQQKQLQQQQTRLQNPLSKQQQSQQQQQPSSQQQQSPVQQQNQSQHRELQLQQQKLQQQQLEQQLQQQQLVPQHQQQQQQKAGQELLQQQRKQQQLQNHQMLEQADKSPSQPKQKNPKSPKSPKKQQHLQQQANAGAGNQTGNQATQMILFQFVQQGRNNAGHPTVTVPNKFPEQTPSMQRQPFSNPHPPNMPIQQTMFRNPRMPPYPVVATPAASGAQFFIMGTQASQALQTLAANATMTYENEAANAMYFQNLSRFQGHEMTTGAQGIGLAYANIPFQFMTVAGAPVIGKHPQQPMSAEAQQQAMFQYLRAIRGVDPSQLVRGVDPSQLVRGIDPGHLVRGVDPSQLIRGVDPNQLVRGVDPSQLGINRAAGFMYPPAANSFIPGIPNNYVRIAPANGNIRPLSTSVPYRSPCSPSQGIPENPFVVNHDPPAINHDPTATVNQAETTNSPVQVSVGIPKSNSDKSNCIFDSQTLSSRDMSESLRSNASTSSLSESSSYCGVSHGYDNQLSSDSGNDNQPGSDSGNNPLTSDQTDVTISSSTHDNSVITPDSTISQTSCLITDTDIQVISSSSSQETSILNPGVSKCTSNNNSPSSPDRVCERDTLCSEELTPDHNRISDTNTNIISKSPSSIIDPNIVSFAVQHESINNADLNTEFPSKETNEVEPFIKESSIETNEFESSVEKMSNETSEESNIECNDTFATIHSKLDTITQHVHSQNYESELSSGGERTARENCVDARQEKSDSLPDIKEESAKQFDDKSSDSYQTDYGEEINLQCNEECGIVSEDSRAPTPDVSNPVLSDVSTITTTPVGTSDNCAILPVNKTISSPKVGDLVWGELSGFTSWPGRVVSQDEVKQSQTENGKVWVRWFGDHTCTQIETERLKALSDGLKELDGNSRRRKNRGGKKTTNNLEQAIYEALQEMEKRSFMENSHVITDSDESKVRPKRRKQR